VYRPLHLLFGHDDVGDSIIAHPSVGRSDLRMVRCVG
jgi:hypothetical protein